MSEEKKPMICMLDGPDPGHEYDSTKPLVKNNCPHCGSSKVDLGYGFGAGPGLGSYWWCDECQKFSNYIEDRA